VRPECLPQIKFKGAKLPYFIEILISAFVKEAIRPGKFFIFLLVGIFFQRPACAQKIVMAAAFCGFKGSEEQVFYESAVFRASSKHYAKS